MVSILNRRGFFGLLFQTRIHESQTRFGSVETHSAAGTHLAISKSAEPSSPGTDSTGQPFDAVVYLDQADGKLKMKRLNGTISILGN